MLHGFICNLQKVLKLHIIFVPKTPFWILRLQVCLSIHDLSEREYFVCSRFSKLEFQRECNRYSKKHHFDRSCFHDLLVLTGNQERFRSALKGSYYLFAFCFVAIRLGWVPRNLMLLHVCFTHCLTNTVLWYVHPPLLKHLAF